MADINDVRALRAARTEFVKRGVDTTRCDIRMHHSVLYIRGAVSVAKGAAIKDLKSEVELIGRVLRQKAEIREVVIDCQYRAT